MDPPIESITLERFESIWERFQNEANKLASGVPCSGVTIYLTIYQIVAVSDPYYSVKLHWSIGRFFCELAKQLRERIAGENWVEEYRRAFCIYEHTIETINMLSPHLNKAIANRKECKPIKELGYILWERFILKQRYEKNEPALYESLPRHRECARDCLRSLEKIVINPNDKLEYYRNSYEAGLLNMAVEEYKQKIKECRCNNIAEYLVASGQRIAEMIEKYFPLLLPVSYDKLEKLLEKAIFPGKTSELANEIQRLLIDQDTRRIEELYTAIFPLKKHIFPIYLEQVRKFSQEHWPSVVNCQIAAQMYMRQAKLFAPNHSSEVLNILSETLSQKLALPEIGKQLAEYLEEIIKGNDTTDPSTFKVLLDAISVPEEKTLFYHKYIAKLCERLLSLRFDYATEKSVAEIIDLPNILKRKVKRIFEDMMISRKENMIFRSQHCTENGMYQGPYGSLKFYAIIITSCMWMIPEESIATHLLPEPIQDAVALFESKYLSRYTKRKLFWSTMLSQVEVEIETDKNYTVSMPLLHTAVLFRIAESPQTPDEISFALGISIALAESILNTFSGHGIFVCKHPQYHFNHQFTSAQMVITIHQKDVATSRVGTRKPYYQACISEEAKKAQTISMSKLENLMTEHHTKLFSWNAQEYHEALLSLKERGLIEIQGNTITYIP
ncbi:hypothetical protein NEOKW01_1287 [Nematocida sp. AWRm80]|nr:hypothetical protein NEOKW01_1287 [Nematocida sp. AWRm80]